jgi:hypothetical protein
MTRKNMAALPALAAALILGGCYKSADTTDGRVDPDAADTIDVHEVLPDLVPDMMPDYPPDLPPDLIDVPPDFPPDYPLEDVPPITAEDYCMGFAAGVCDYFLGCCTAAELEELGVMEVDCYDPMESDIFRECMDEFGDAIRSNRIIVDYGGYYAMLSELRNVAVECPNLGASPLMKDYLFRLWTGTALLGQLDVGMRCILDEECREGLYCDVYTGLCTATVRLGGVCRDDPECGPGNVCNLGRCAAPQSAGGPCDDYDDCGVGLWCDGESCQSVLPPGAPCQLEMMNCQGLCTLEFPTGTCRDFCNGD